MMGEDEAALSVTDGSVYWKHRVSYFIILVVMFIKFKTHWSWETVLKDNLCVSPA